MSNVAPFPSPAVSREPKRRTKRRILNASTLKALVPPPTGSVDHFDDLTPGLSLRVTSNDVRSCNCIGSYVAVDVIYACEIR